MAKGGGTDFDGLDGLVSPGQRSQESLGQPARLSIDQYEWSALTLLSAGRHEASERGSLLRKIEGALDLSLIHI